MSMSDPFFDPDDLNEPSHYCPHGRFIGNPYGADYMCFYCEMGFSDEEYAAEVQYKQDREIIKHLKAEYFKELRATSVWATFYHVNPARIGERIAASAKEVDAMSHEDLVDAAVNYLGWVRV